MYHGIRNLSANRSEPNTRLAIAPVVCYDNFMAALKEKLAADIPALRKELQGIIKQHGSKKLSETTVEKSCAGLRSVHSLLCDTSEVDPNLGLLIRGRPISELTDRLPEEIFYYLLTGENPNADRRS